MADFVVDASVVLSWCFDDERDDYAERVLDALPEREAAAPHLLPMELANALVVAERRGRLKAADADRFLTFVGGLPLRIHDASLAVTAPALLAAAREHRLSAYDAAYLRLAVELRLPLASRDIDLRRAATAAQVPIFAM